MKLVQMTVNGLGSYATEQTVVFATGNNKNITVFHGENGAGKTSMLNAILWGLTGQVSPGLIVQNDKQKQRDVLINHHSAEEGLIPTVKIDFEHEGTDYRARRKLDSNEISGTFELWAKRNGTLDPFANQSQSVMAKIVPPGLARYFIFDGEGFAKSAAQSQSIFRQSVDNILGFDFLERAIKRIESVRDKKAKEAGKISSKRIADKKKRKAYEEAQEQFESSKIKIERLSKIIPVLREELENIKLEILSLNEERVRELQKTKSDLTRDMMSLKAHLRDLEARRLGLISHYYRPIFGRDIITKSLLVIESQRQKKIIPGPFNKQFIKDLIHDETCICGEDLDEGKIAKLQKILEKGYTSSLQQRLTKAQAVSADDIEKVNEFRTQYQELTMSIVDNKNHYDGKAEQYKATDSELEELAGRDELLKELRNNEAKKNAELLTAIDEQDSAILLKNSADKARSAYAGQAGPGSNLEAKLRNQVKRLDEIIEYGNLYIQTEMNKCHTFIKTEMQRFIDGTNIPYVVTLDTNFKFQFRTSNGRGITGSTGEQKTLEFAFLCSLVKLVKEKSLNTGGLLLPASSVPLVIDAPFSDIAEKYIKYISDMLLDVSEQLTILTINKDWPALEKATDGKVGKEYLLIKNIVQSSDDRMQENHIFRGKEYVCVKYGAEYDHTTLEEVVDV